MVLPLLTMVLPLLTIPPQLLLPMLLPSKKTPPLKAMEMEGDAMGKLPLVVVRECCIAWAVP